MSEAPHGLVDVVVIGGSAGSFTALKSILPGLPADLPAAVFVCQHMASMGESHAAALLAPYAHMPVVVATDGMAIEPGRIVFAAPDMHLLLGRHHVHLRRGSHENNFRPAIDPLFRSAAVYHGTRAVGVVLSGLLDDGAAGARAMHRTGGRIVVQAPETADFPDMPGAALTAVPGADPVPLNALASRVADLVGRPAAPPREVPWSIGIELKIAGLEGASIDNEEKLGELSPYNCPGCNGVLWQIEDGPMTRFRCHTGHAYTMHSLDESQEVALDHGLFDSLRAHRERVAMIRQMAAKAARDDSRYRLEARAERFEEDARRLEAIIRSRRAG